MPRVGAALPRRYAQCALATATLAFSPRVLFAHVGEPLRPHDLFALEAWTLDPLLLASLLLPAWLFVRGTRRVWARAGKGRGVRHWQAMCAASGLLALVVALVSPLGRLGGALFSAHMLQHQVLMVVAAPLLVLGAPLVAPLWAFDPAQRRWLGAVGRRIAGTAAWRTLTGPLVAFALHALAIWLWHLPALYERTLYSESMHTLQHTSFFGTALLFWWSVLHPRAPGMSGRVTAFFSVFLTAVHGSLLGAMLTFSPNVWYSAYAGRVEPWGFTLLQDQQLGGLVMWVPAGIVYTIAALLLMWRGLRSMETHAPVAAWNLASRNRYGL